ncbi:MAG: aldo/keto reductase family protein [Acidimicrobiia bacterium]|nr:aldo/keto reductase family protein [Acidimicrobiia bacterium]
MEYRQLGRSDLTVSEISLGSWLTYGVGVEADAARACVEKALDVGINFFDTANAYGRGAAEEFLGETLAGIDRSSYVLATKVFFPMSPKDRGLSAAQIHKQIEASLKRLRTDYVDLYQCHRYDRDTPLAETMQALTDVVLEGKARYVGISEWKAHQIQAALDMPDAVRIVSSQPQYSMLYRVPEKEVFPLCEKEGIGNVVWSPLAQGILTGKYVPGSPPPEDSRAASESMGQMMGRWRDDDVLAAVQKLKPIADGAGLTMAQLALTWVLREPVVSSAIIGATRPEQVEDNAAASGVKLSDDALAAIDEVLEPVLSV